MKIISRMLAFILAVFVVMTSSACMQADDEEEFSVVCTLFPQYDFARELLGDSAQITLLLPPGVESHSYDPTPSDILEILECDLFIYTGDEMEPWAAKILAGVGKNVQILDLSRSVELLCADEHDHNHEEHHEHSHEYDPHIWTSPANAALMTEAIAGKLCEMLPGYEQSISDNCVRYTSQLWELDGEFAQLSELAEHTTVIFSGRFAMHYFTERYGFEWIAAYDSCSHEAEPSIYDIIEIIDIIEQEGLTAVYYEELVDPAVARIIARQTGVEPLLLHSCHNLSASELEAGETYISLMQQNLVNLKEGLL